MEQRKSIDYVRFNKTPMKWVLLKFWEQWRCDVSFLSPLLHTDRWRCDHVCSPLSLSFSRSNHPFIVCGEMCGCTCQTSRSMQICLNTLGCVYLWAPAVWSVWSKNTEDSETASGLPHRDNPTHCERYHRVFEKTFDQTLQLKLWKLCRSWILSVLPGLGFSVRMETIL